MKKLILLSAMILIGSSALIAQPALEWQKNFLGGTSSYKSEFNAVVSTSDGGYIAVGKGWGSGGDLPGGYIDKRDALIVKTAADGTVQWSKYWGQQEEDAAMSVIQTADGGYVVAGYTAHLGTLSLGANDGFVVKYDAVGTLLWEHVYGGSGHDFIYDIKATPDGGYVFVGTTKSPEVAGYHSGNDLWVAKLDGMGTQVWGKAKGYTGGNECAYSVSLTPDGAFIVTGYTTSSGATNYKGASDMWVLKLSASGVIAWQNCIGGTKDDLGQGVILASDNSIWVVGGTKSNDGDISGNHSADKNDLLLAHLDPNGVLLTTKVYGGSENEGGISYNSCIKQSVDGGFVLLSSTSSNNGDVSGNHGGYDFWLTKVNASAGLEWQQCIGTSEHDYGKGLALSADGGYILAGKINNANACLVKIMGSPSGIQDLAGLHTSLYPNPVGNELNIASDKALQSACIMDVLGREVMAKTNLVNNKINVAALSAGVYFVQLHFKDGQSGIQRIVKK